MSITFAAQLRKMITAGLGGAMDAPETNVAVGYRIRTETETGNPLEIDVKERCDAESCIVRWMPVQDLNGYDHPWPAGGGANQWDEEWELGDIDSSTGEDTTTGNIIRTKGYIPVLPETEYFAYIGGLTGANLRTRFYDINKNYIGYTQYNGSPVAYNSVFKTPENCYYMRFTPQEAYGTEYLHNISINYPHTVTTYSPYSNICPISGWTEIALTQEPSSTPGVAQEVYVTRLGGTYYGGELETVSGAGSATHGKYTFDGTETWVQYSSGTWFTTVLADAKYGNDVSVISDTFAGHVSGGGGAYTGSADIWLQNNIAYKRLYVSCGAASQAEMQAATTGATVVYPLATPIPFTSTDHGPLTLPEGESRYSTDSDQDVTIVWKETDYTEGY